VTDRGFEKTISDFGDQWVRYKDNSGFYGSLDLFSDIVTPLMTTDEFSGTRVADIGSGTGRIVQMLIGAGAKEVVAIEPSSKAFGSLLENTRGMAHRIRYLNISGEELPTDLELDYVVSIGVIHHIAKPEKTVEACYRALKPGGRCLFWLYGHEGNELYLSLARPLRKFTTKLPHLCLAGLCHMLNLCLDVYILLCRFLKLPLRDYVRNVLQHMARDKRYLIVYDQLNPEYAKYYRRREAVALLELAGFSDVKIFHRHGYSWLVVGRK
jgi:SAM-dependent methyltransferase